MRERISLYGGTLRAGPRPGGGFRVFARIPLEGEQGNRIAGAEEGGRTPAAETSGAGAVSVHPVGKDIA
jgi:hypothetical protein